VVEDEYLCPLIEHVSLAEMQSVQFPCQMKLLNYLIVVLSLVQMKVYLDRMSYIQKV